jgi:hypothetical protein
MLGKLMTPEETKIHNLLCFVINFSKYSGMNHLTYQSPNYILEKFNSWIVGEVPRKYWEFSRKYKDFEFKEIDLIDEVSQLNDKQIFTYMEYQRIWGKLVDDKVKRVLIYLMKTTDLNLFNCSNQFERLIGSVSDINSGQGSTLHEIIMRDMYPIIVERNKFAIQTILRDLKISSIEN